MQKTVYGCHMRISFNWGCFCIKFSFLEVHCVLFITLHFYHFRFCFAIILVSMFSTSEFDILCLSFIICSRMFCLYSYEQVQRVQCVQQDLRTRLENLKSPLVVGVVRVAQLLVF